MDDVSGSAIDRRAVQVRDRVWEIVGRPDGAVPLHEPTIGGHAWEYVRSCLDDGWVSTAGAFVDRFERELASTLGVASAVAVINGTAALHLALRVVGVERGDEVLMPTLTFVATANAAAYLGAVPHFVDASEATLGIDPERLAEHLDAVAELRDDGAYHRATGRRLSACVPMHTYGHPVRMDRLLEVCDGWGIPVVEDAAESLGSTFRGAHAGSFGRVGILSFNGNKIVTTGGGGAIVTNDPEVGARVRHLATTAKLQHRWRFDHDDVGHNYRMPNLNAALGVAQLEMLAGFVEQKRRLAQIYHEAFTDIDGVSVFTEPAESESNYWLNVLLLDRPDADERDALLEAAHGRGLLIRPAWTLMHQLPMYRGAPRMDTSVAERLEASLVNLPSTPHLATPAKAWLRSMAASA